MTTDGYPRESVIPAKAGIQDLLLDTRLRGNDDSRQLDGALAYANANPS
jgi:hypothetical protein